MRGTSAFGRLLPIATQLPVSDPFQPVTNGGSGGRVH